MTGKALRIALLATPLLVGCAIWRKTPAAEPAPIQQIAPKEGSPRGAATTPLRPAKTRSSSAPATSQPAPPRAPTTTTPVIVTRVGATQAQPVPLFRQAIVLANVRAAVAGLPAQPKAEFQRGLLTLTFPRGTQAEMAAAVNRAFAVPEVSRIQVVPAP